MSDTRFKNAEDQYFTLKGQVASGRITQSQFQAALKDLMLQDDQGRYWMLRADDGQWFVHDGKQWATAQPPDAQEPIARALAAQPPVAQSSTSAPSTPTILNQLQESIRQILARLAGPASSAPEAQPSAGSIRESLMRLGVSFTRKQITGFVLSILGGMVMARVLPFVYPIFDPIITVMFGSGAGGARDGFNTNMMTLITFSTSFGLSFLTMVLTKVQKR